MGIRAAVPEAHILVVDDNSPDGTGELADALARDDRVTCCTARARPGLGRAYTAGFAHALARGAGYVVEMDADLSHDPADLPRLIAPALGRRRPRARLALRRTAAGSRTGACSGGCISLAGCGYARRVLGVDVRDLTGGFKCFRAADAAARSTPRTAGAQGYAFQVELT